jgi:protein phosphatase 4 regulatory subunit 3
LNKDEERYFSEDGPDDEDEPVQLISSPTIISKGNVNTLKRKRAGAGLRSSTRSLHMAVTRSPPMSSLVDYGEDEDEDSLGGVNGVDELAGFSRRKITGSPTGPPATPRLSHRRIASQTFQPLPTPDDEDEEDSLLEALVSKSPGPSKAKPNAAASPKPGSQFSIGPLRSAGEKRRRDEDEDDGLFERLATKAKRHSTGNGSGGGVSGEKCTGSSEEGGPVVGVGGPKKIKLKFGAALKVAASPSPTTSPVSSEPGAKDGDTG